jgi:hypothetical protein
LIIAVPHEAACSLEEWQAATSIASLYTRHDPRLHKIFPQTAKTTGESCGREPRCTAATIPQVQNALAERHAIS